MWKIKRNASNTSIIAFFYFVRCQISIIHILYILYIWYVYVYINFKLVLIDFRIFLFEYFLSIYKGWSPGLRRGGAEAPAQWLLLVSRYSLCVCLVCEFASLLCVRSCCLLCLLCLFLKAVRFVCVPGGDVYTCKGGLHV